MGRNILTSSSSKCVSNFTVKEREHRKLKSSYERMMNSGSNSKPFGYTISANSLFLEATEKLKDALILPEVFGLAGNHRIIIQETCSSSPVLAIEAVRSQLDRKRKIEVAIDGQSTSLPTATNVLKQEPQTTELNMSADQRFRLGANVAAKRKFAGTEESFA